MASRSPGREHLGAGDGRTDITHGLVVLIAFLGYLDVQGVRGEHDSHTSNGHHAIAYLLVDLGCAVVPHCWCDLPRHLCLVVFLLRGRWSLESLLQEEARGKSVV